MKTKNEFAQTSDSVAKAIDELTHGCDGPVTMFVVYHRAMILARLNAYPMIGIYDPLAEALAEVATRGYDEV